MSDEKPFVHPYIPNSVPEVKARMLREIGVSSIDELYADIPERLRFKGRMNLPEPLAAEGALKRHVEAVLSRNRSAAECLCFLGGGCWPHDVPAICDEINRLPVHTIQRGFREADLDGAALAIAATDDQAVNAAVARAAGERGIPVNVVDQPGLCSFYLPAVVRRGGLVIGVSTSGASPSLARRIRERLEDEFGSEYGQYVELLDGLRQQVIDQVTADKRRGVFEQMASDEILGILRTHGRAAAERALHQILNDAGKKPDQP